MTVLMASPRYLFCQALLCESLAVSGAQKPIRRTNAGVRRLYNVAYSLAEPNSDSRTLDEPLRKLAESRRMKERSIEKGFAPTLIPIDGARSASRNDSVRPCATPSVTRRDPTSQRGLDVGFYMHEPFTNSEVVEWINNTLATFAGSVDMEKVWYVLSAGDPDSLDRS